MESASSLTLSCPYVNNVIQIVKAFYGREREDLCESPNATDLTCSSNIAAERLSDLCDGKNVCNVGLHRNLLGDPCPGNNKYLEVDYMCAG